MFFDRLLKLQTLKFRLLGSSSFTQLYSAERLPLRKFRKEGAMLSPLIAGLLAACGGGGGGVVPIRSGGDSPGPTERDDPDDIIREVIDASERVGSRADEAFTTFDVTGSDIAGAALYFDPNADGVLDEDEKTEANHLGTSEISGEVEVSNARLRELFGEDATEISIIADLEGAINRDTGEVYDEGDYQHTIISRDAIGSLKVLSVITTIFEELKETGLSEEEALETIFGEDTNVTEEDINDPDNYVALPAGVIVPDNSNLETQKVISFTAKVLVELVEQVEESNEIEDTDDGPEAVSKVAEYLENKVVTIDAKATTSADYVEVSPTDKDGQVVTDIV